MLIKKFTNLFADETGMTTAEYAVGTVAAAGLGSVLLKVLLSPAVKDLIMRAIEHAFSFLFG
jgi:Flp pilus assembly pilin Flp